MTDVKDQVSIGQRLTALEEKVSSLEASDQFTNLAFNGVLAMHKAIIEEIHSNRKRLKKLEKRSKADD